MLCAVGTHLFKIDITYGGDPSRLLESAFGTALAIAAEIKETGSAQLGK
jgi:hypothetical protein